jgi:hypothetical protein
MVLCNVCGSANAFSVTLSGELMRMCAGCGNVQSQPSPDGHHAGWKRHGVKLTTSRQIEEVERETQKHA